MSATEDVDEGEGGREALTAADVAALDGQVVARAAAFARLAGTALVVAGAVGLAAWVWMAYRMQARADDVGTVGPLVIGGMEGPEYRPSLAERLDLLVTTIQLGVVAVLAIALGLATRLVADYTVTRTGGSLTGFAPGDTV